MKKSDALFVVVGCAVKIKKSTEIVRITYCTVYLDPSIYCIANIPTVLGGLEIPFFNATVQRTLCDALYCSSVASRLLFLSYRSRSMYSTGVNSFCWWWSVSGAFWPNWSNHISYVVKLLHLPPPCCDATIVWRLKIVMPACELSLRTGRVLYQPLMHVKIEKSNPGAYRSFEINFHHCHSY